MVVKVEQKNITADFAKVKRALQKFQVDRLNADYECLKSNPDWDLLFDYFVNDIYCPKEYTEDQDHIKRITALLKKSLGKKVFSKLIKILEIHTLSIELDHKLVTILIEMGVGNKITLADYNYAYRLCDNYNERKKQLELIVECCHNLHQVASHWYIGLLLKSVRVMAGILGGTPLLDSLEKGYTILHNVKDIHFFTDQIYDHELARLNNIYEKVDQQKHK